MAFLTRALWGGAKAMVGGGARRVAVGAAAGGAYGGFTSENRTGTGIFRDVLGGALAGAGIGGLTTRTAFAAARGLVRVPHTIRAYNAARRMGAGPIDALSFGRYAAVNASLGKNVAEAAGGGLRLGAGIAGAGLKGGYQVGRFAIRNPRTAGAIGLAGLGVYGLATSGAASAYGDVNDMAAIAMAHGGPSTGFMPGMGGMARQESRMMFMNSTHGLAQGMHRGRHR